jgi:GNAT superfamily N-acetyltransferase
VNGTCKGDPLRDFDRWLTGEGLVGKILIALDRGILSAFDIYIKSIAVPERYQHQGIAKKVMQKLVEISEQYDVPLGLEASEESEDADWLQEWYKRLGFDYGSLGFGDYGPYMVRDRKGLTVYVLGQQPVTSAGSAVASLPAVRGDERGIGPRVRIF